MKSNRLLSTAAFAVIAGEDSERSGRKGGGEGLGAEVEREVGRLEVFLLVSREQQLARTRFNLQLIAGN